MQPNGQPYQLGGWYNGRQWNGTSFTQPAGVEAIGANAGKAVNSTVVAASNTAQGLKTGTNETYIAAQNGDSTSTTTPGVVAEEDPYGSPELVAANKAIEDRQLELNKEIQGINDNPFLAEDVRTRKLSSAQSKANADLLVHQQTVKNQLEIAKQKEASNKTTIKTFTDNNGKVTASVMDSEGNVIKTTDLGSIGKATKTAAGKATTPKITATDKAVLQEGVASDAKDGNSLAEIVGYYKTLGLDEKTIYNIYNKNSIYGKAEETLADVVAGKFISQ